MSHKRLRLSALTACGFVLTAGIPAFAVGVDFDTLPVGVNSGSVYQASIGLNISTGSMPNNTHAGSDGVRAGDIFTWTTISNTFRVLDSSPDAISPPNLAMADGDPLNDVMFTLSAPVTSFTLSLDNTHGETAADIVRLIAVAQTTIPNVYLVLNAVEQWDNVVFPDTFLTISSSGRPFSRIIFQTTTEQEGFENLSWNPIYRSAAVPEPGTVALLSGVMLSGSVLLRRRRTVSR